MRRLFGVSSPKMKSFPFLAKFLCNPMAADLICKAPIITRAAINIDLLHDIFELSEIDCPLINAYILPYTLSTQIHR